MEVSQSLLRTPVHKTAIVTVSKELDGLHLLNKKLTETNQSECCIYMILCFQLSETNMPKRFKATPVIMILFKDVHNLEHDASSQYKFNRFFVIAWIAAMVAIPFDPHLYGHSAATLIIQEVSLWANAASHFGGMSSALAAKNTSRPSETINLTVENVLPEGAIDSVS